MSRQWCSFPTAPLTTQGYEAQASQIKDRLAAALAARRTPNFDDFPLSLTQQVMRQSITHEGVNLVWLDDVRERMAGHFGANLRQVGAAEFSRQIVGSTAIYVVVTTNSGDTYRAIITSGLPYVVFDMVPAPRRPSERRRRTAKAKRPSF